MEVGGDESTHIWKSAAVVLGIGATSIVGATLTSTAGPILAFVGAVLVAGIAAYTADRRQTKALNAERHRLSDQLAHDRRLSDVADLRAVLQDALEASDEMREACFQLQTRGKSTEREERYRIAQRRSSRSANALQIRLADDDAIVMNHYELMMANHDLFGAIGKEREEFTAIQAGGTEPYRAIVEAAKGRVGTITE